MFIYNKLCVKGWAGSACHGAGDGGLQDSQHAGELVSGGAFCFYTNDMNVPNIHSQFGEFMSFIKSEMFQTNNQVGFVV